MKVGDSREEQRPHPFYLSNAFPHTELCFFHFVVCVFYFLLFLLLFFFWKIHYGFFLSLGREQTGPTRGRLFSGFVSPAEMRESGGYALWIFDAGQKL